MLRTRMITAIVLLAVLVLILYLHDYMLFAAATALFFGAASWECHRLQGARYPVRGAFLWTAAFICIAFLLGEPAAQMYLAFLFAAGTGIWALCLTPLLAIGLPPLAGRANRILSVLYPTSVLACFVAMLLLFRHSAVYLFSVLALVWVADIGAYFFGKAFGRRKLAPIISPGKSWEGAAGGWAAVMLIAAASTRVPALRGTFAAEVQSCWGWLGFAVTMSLIVAASVVGDLFESQLKRRISMKDSSRLLPGHGGVLDRIDALIPVLPLTVLIFNWLRECKI